MLGVHPRLPQHLSPHLWLQDDGGPPTLSVFCCVIGERKRPRSTLSWLVNPPADSAHSPSAPPSDIPRADAGSVRGGGRGVGVEGSQGGVGGWEAAVTPTVQARSAWPGQGSLGPGGTVPATEQGPPGEAGEKQCVDTKGTLAVPPARVLLSVRQRQRGEATKSSTDSQLLSPVHPGGLH